jgi:uncharacterized protein YecT (DUF1311 family)
MRTLPFILLLVLGCTMSSAAIRDDEMTREALKDCDKNQLAMNFCARHAFDLVDDELNKSYRAILATLISPQAKNRLRQAQRAWVEFRDKDCLVLVGPPEYGGSMYQGMWWRCLANRTRERLVELDTLSRLLRCEEQPCPPKE